MSPPQFSAHLPKSTDTQREGTGLIERTVGQAFGDENHLAKALDVTVNAMHEKEDAALEKPQRFEKSNAVSWIKSCIR